MVVGRETAVGEPEDEEEGEINVSTDHVRILVVEPMNGICIVFKYK